MVRGSRQPVTKPLKSVRQVVSVQAKSDGRPGSGEVQAFTVETEMGADIREALASVNAEAIPQIWRTRSPLKLAPSV